MKIIQKLTEAFRLVREEIPKAEEKDLKFIEYQITEIVRDVSGTFQGMLQNLCEEAQAAAIKRLNELEGKQEAPPEKRPKKG